MCLLQLNITLKLTMRKSVVAGALIGFNKRSEKALKFVQGCTGKSDLHNKSCNVFPSYLWFVFDVVLLNNDRPQWWCCILLVGILDFIICWPMLCSGLCTLTAYSNAFAFCLCYKQRISVPRHKSNVLDGFFWSMSVCVWSGLDSSRGPFASFCMSVVVVALTHHTCMHHRLTLAMWGCNTLIIPSWHSAFLFPQFWLLVRHTSFRIYD